MCDPPGPQLHHTFSIFEAGTWLRWAGFMLTFSSFPLSLFLLVVFVLYFSFVVLEDAMSEQSARVTPAELGFLAIYNPSLGTTDETLEDMIVYYSSPESRGDRSRQKDLSESKAIQDAIREQSNEQLRQIGLAQGMVEFGRSFSEGKSVDTIETEKSRIILHELEAGWWILAVSQTPLARNADVNCFSQSISPSSLPRPLL